MKKFFRFLILTIAVCAVGIVYPINVNAASAPKPIASVIATKPEDIGWEGYTESPALKFYVDETAANNTGNIIDPTDGNRIFKNFLNAIDYRKNNFPGQPVEINLRSNITNVANFGDRLTNVLVVGNGYSFKRVSGNVVRAFETSRQVMNVEFRDVSFDGGALLFGAGIVFEGYANHHNIKFTNVSIDIDVEAKPQANGHISPPRVISFFDASNVTFDGVDMSGSACVNSPGYQWPVQIYSNCRNFDLSGLISMPFNDSGKPVAIALWNNLGPDTEPYNIYAPTLPYLLTYRSERGHRTLAFRSLHDAKTFAAENNMVYPQNIDLIVDGVVIGEPTMECILDLSTNAFIINSAATLENAVNFFNTTDHGPSHTAEITGPDVIEISVGDEGSCAFEITDTAGASYIFDFSETAEGRDYILESSDENVIASAALSIGERDNAISFKGAGAGKAVISLMTMDGTTVFSVEITVRDSNMPEPPETGDSGIAMMLIIFGLSALSLGILHASKQSKKFG